MKQIHCMNNLILFYTYVRIIIVTKNVPSLYFTFYVLQLKLKIQYAKKTKNNFYLFILVNLKCYVKNDSKQNVCKFDRYFIK